MAKRILVVEDDLPIREGIVDILEIAGYEVDSAANGKEGLERIQAAQPDLIISDIMMPEMDGYAFYKAVHQNPQWAAIPFIFLTAKGEKEDIRLGRALGADEYIVKPFEREDLLLTVEARLRRAEEMRRPYEEEIEAWKERMAQSERLAALGEMAAEFAHEIKSPLTAITMYAQFVREALAKGELDEADRSLEDLGKIIRQSERIARLTNNLLTFARQAPLEPRPIDLHVLLNEVLDLLSFRFEKHGIAVKTEYDPHLPFIVADPSQLEQVFLNLVVNAMQAMRPGGVLTLRTGSTEEQGETKVWVAVEDTGCGIPPDLLERIFEPFFTTKDHGEGTGLGLYVCRRIVNKHGGHIEVQSEVGQGSTFTVYLPLKPPEQPPEESSEDQAPGA